MRVDVITIFPEMFKPFLGEGMVRIALDKGALDVSLHDLRDYSGNKHRKVDDRPYGGGPGMVLTPGPVFDAIESIVENNDDARFVLPTPQGKRLEHPKVVELSKEERIVILCGRYEGYDERIRQGFPWDEISIGDYVTTGGELPAMVVIDAAARLLPGVLGDELSAVEDSFYKGTLDHPHYTRPEDFRGMKVPEVLLNGDHAAIEEWRRVHREKRTAERRPDLMEREVCSEDN